MTYSSHSFNGNQKHVVEASQSFVLSKQHEHIQQIEYKTDAMRHEYQTETFALRRQVDDLLGEIIQLRQTMRSGQEHLLDLQTELAILRYQRQQNEEEMMGRLTPMMNQLVNNAIDQSQEHMIKAIAPLISDAIQAQIDNSPEEMADVIGSIMGEAIQAQIRESRHDMVEAIGPVMGEAIRVQVREAPREIVEAIGPLMGESIRVQIREGRQEMVEALYPIIGQTVQRAVSEFWREFQRQMDVRLRKTFGPKGLLRGIWARLQGVSASELALRDSLPFTIHELFLIQRHSGLLMAHNHFDDLVSGDSDLISGMLTAVRDLVQDSFGDDYEVSQLDEIVYGDYRIIIQSGPAAYLAAVIEGVEPPGFHARLQSLISEFHVRYDAVFRKYNGDPSILPNLQPTLAQWARATVGVAPPPAEIKRSTKWVLATGGVASMVFVLFLCFYIQFTVALLPLAFPSMKATSASVIDSNPIGVIVPENTPTPTPTPTATQPAPTATAIATSTSQPTMTTTPTVIPSKTVLPTTTASPPIEIGATIAFTSGNVWIRDVPDINAPHSGVLALGANVTVLEFTDSWVKVQWEWEGELDSGWIPLQWVQALENG